MTMIEFRAMGSQICAIVDAEQVDSQLQDLQACFAAWEQILSRFRPESELAMLNDAPGRWVAVSPTFALVVEVALAAARQTDGLVTPTILGSLEQAGYDRDFADLAAEQAQHRPQRPSTWPADWRLIGWDAQQQRIYVPHGLRLDMGGVAKGWAADQAIQQLKQLGPALVDAGGDIAISGPRADGSPWPIAVEDPFGGEAPLDLLLLNTGAVATSGRDYRRWRQGNRECHHIIDPRTGAPAETDLLSVTVVAANVAEAEAAAKAVLILGSQAGMAWLADRPCLAGLLVCANGTILRTATLDAYRWTSNS